VRRPAFLSTLLSSTRPFWPWLPCPEDEESVRKITRIMLESLVYTVLMAGDGAGAVALFKEQRDRIDIVLLDVIMPGMNGDQVLRELRRLRPDVNRVFMSGYAADVISGRGFVDAKNMVIARPISLQELASKIRLLLDGGGWAAGEPTSLSRTSLPDHGGSGHGTQ